MRFRVQFLGLFFILLFTLACATKQSQTTRDYVRVSESSTKILIGSCNDQELDQSFWKTLTKQNGDMMILMGDNVYNEHGDQQSLRRAYNKLASNPWFKEFKNSTPLVATWDDGDYGQNDGGEDFAYKQDSKELFLDFWDEPKNSDRRLRDGIYDSFVVGPPGASLQVILLDTRSFRSPLQTVRQRVPGLGPYGPSLDPRDTLLGKAQWIWLKKQLETPADVRLIVSSIQVTADEHGFETWGNFPKERNTLLSLLDKTKAKQILLLSGDRHHSSFWEWKRLRRPILYEFTSSSLNRPLRPEYQIDRPESHKDGTLEFRPSFGILFIDWNKGSIVTEMRLSNGELIRQKEIPFREDEKRN